MIGIYYITNTINNKIYIGSSNNIEKRHRTHFSNLRYGKHPNRYLQSAVTKYGIDSFTFKAIEICEQHELLSIEQEHIDNYDKDMLYNLTFITSGGGADTQRFPTYLLDLEGNLINEFESILKLGEAFNTIIGSSASVNTGSIFRRKYRVVTKEFYNNNLEVIKSWLKYPDPLMRNYKEKRNSFHKNREIIVTCNGIDTEYKTNNEAAAALGITGERVRQLLNKSSKKYNIRFKNN